MLHVSDPDASVVLVRVDYLYGVGPTGTASLQGSYLVQDAHLRRIAWLGPAIRVCCFEVGEEVAEQFPGFVDRTIGAKPHVDIAAFTRELLQARGITEADARRQFTDEFKAKIQRAKRDIAQGRGRIVKP